MGRPETARIVRCAAVRAGLRVRALLPWLLLVWSPMLPALVGQSVQFRALLDPQPLPALRAIAQDGVGLVWFGSEHGLYRYDGHAVRAFRRGEPPLALPDDAITALAADGDAGLWIGSADGRLLRYHTALQQFEAIALDSRGGVVSALLQDRGGALWIGLDDGRLLRRSGNRDHAVAVLGEQAAGAIVQLREAADGSVLVVAGGRVWRADAAGRVLRPLPLGLPAAHAVADALIGFDGSLWVATTAGPLLQFDVGGQLRRRLAARDGVDVGALHALHVDRGGRLWMAGDHGIARLDTPVAQARRWHGEDLSGVSAVPAGRIDRLFEDRDGVLWIGGPALAPHRFDPRSEAFVRARPGGGGRLRALAGAAEGLWLARAEPAEVLRLDAQLATVARAALPAAALADLRGIVGTADGGAWLALGSAGAARLHADGSLAERIERGDARGGLPDAPVSAVWPAGDGRLWLGFDGGGLASRCAGCRDFERRRHDPADPGSLADDQVLALIEDTSGALWVGTRRGGLDRFDPLSGRFEHVATPSASVPATEGATPIQAAVVHLALDRAGDLWVSTQGAGLLRLRRQARDGRWQLDRFDRSRGLAADRISAAAEDRHGRVWAASAAGLTRLDPASGAVDRFGVALGSLPHGYLDGAAASLADGRIALAGSDGLLVFDPRDVRPPPPPRQVQLTALEALTPAGTVVLPLPAADDTVTLAGTALRVEFAASTRVAADELVYELRLDPVDRDWRRLPAGRREAVLPALADGSYRLRARARRGHGEPGEELQLDVNVDTGAGATRWAGIAAALLATVLAGAGALSLLLARERRARRRLQQDDAARLDLALWGTGDELWELDLERGRVRRVNPLRHVALPDGGSQADLQHLQAIVHPEDRAAFDAAIESVLAGRSEQLDVVYRARGIGDAWYWLRVRGKVLARAADGRPLRLAGTVADVSELQEQQLALERVNRELEQRVRERTQALSRANAELGSTLEQLTRTQGQLVEQEKMAALGGLVAGVAHEINTPLGIAVTAASHLEAAAQDIGQRFGEGRLTRGELDAFTRQTTDGAALILRNLERADKLVKSFKQVAVDQASDQRRRIDLAEYLDEVVTSLRPAYRRGRHRVDIDVDGAVILDTLPGAIYQVLANLMQNSVVHGFAERSEGRIRISARRDRGDCVIEYADDGVGMDEPVRRRIFEPFYTTRRGHGGSGLGMHIVYNLVTRALRGAISCESSPGQGARFVIRFPAILPAEAEVEPDPAVPQR